jgi:hypothetical protein
LFENLKLNNNEKEAETNFYFNTLKRLVCEEEAEVKKEMQVNRTYYQNPDLK